MQMTAKHQKVLSAAKTKSGFPLGVYTREAHELRDAGLIKIGHKYSAVGTSSLRWFAMEAA
jgi:hypothetical protein